MTRIAVIEDDAGLNAGIVLALKNETFQFEQYASLSEAKAAGVEERVDLILLDINLPDGNGFDYLKEIRKRSQVPVIILTANDLELDEVMGLELGADDYITKPFSLMVLRARIQKVLQKGKKQAAVYETGELRFDFGRMHFYRCGQELELSKTEQKLLKLLVENRGNALARAAMIDAVWTDGVEYVDENALSVAVKRLRDKIEAEPSRPQYIQTVYGIGYVWRGQGK